MEKGNFSQVAAAIVGALFFTTMCVGAAVGPARAIETAPVTLAVIQSVDGVPA